MGTASDHAGTTNSATSVPSKDSALILAAAGALLTTTTAGEVSSAKAWGPADLSEAGSSMRASAVRRKAAPTIRSTFGRWTAIRWAQSSKAWAPISVTAGGTKTTSTPEFRKAWAPIFLRFDGSLGERSLVQPAKACSGIVPIVSASWMLSRRSQPSKACSGR